MRHCLWIQLHLHLIDSLVKKCLGGQFVALHDGLTSKETWNKDFWIENLLLFLLTEHNIFLEILFAIVGGSLSHAVNKEVLKMV